MAKATLSQQRYRWMMVAIAVFFCWGLATVLIDSLVPKLKELFQLTYAEVLLTQFSFFLGYLVFSLPAGHILARLGYARSVVLGLSIAIIGCLCLIPATHYGRFPWFLLALFVLSAGITLLQVSVNPLVMGLGEHAQAQSRLTLAQAFNSLGTTVGPLIGAAVILRYASRQDMSPLRWPFLAIACVFSLLAWLFWRERGSPAIPPLADIPAKVDWQIFRHRQFAWGWVALFVYVGAEVTLGSLMTNFLMQRDVLGLSAPVAGGLVSLYWGGAMMGRFVGSWVLTRMPAPRLLAICALVASVLVVGAYVGSGVFSAASLILIGLCHSIMFPVIYALSLEGLGDDLAQASGLLCLAIVGGAVIPLMGGMLADHEGLRQALLLPLLCYAVIVFFARRARLA